MKGNTQPCINNYLSIHVPAATLLNEYRNKKKQIISQVNPFENKKLQTIQKKSDKRSSVQCIYTSLPNKSFGKKKKTTSIPLLKNIYHNSDMKLRIVREETKNVYNLVFQKKSLTLSKKQTVNRHSQQSSRTPQITRNISRSLMKTSGSFRKLEPNIDQMYLSGPIQIDSMHLPRQINQAKELLISGNKAPTHQSPEHHRNSQPTKMQIIQNRHTMSNFSQYF